MAAAKPPRAPKDEDARPYIRPLLEAVRRGEMTPRQVDDRCRAEGLRLPHENPESLHDITSNSTWWLPVVVLFYAWRDLANTRVQSERLDIWGRAIWRDDQYTEQMMALDEAEELLKSDLRSGIVRSFGTNNDNKVVQIEPSAWFDLSFPSSSPRGLVWGVLDREGQNPFRSVFVLRHEVVPLWINELASLREGDQSKVRERSSPTTRGGAPVQHTWNQMWIEVCRIIHEEGVPEGKVALRKRMQNWFAEQGFEAPADQTMNRVLGDLFEKLNQP